MEKLSKKSEMFITAEWVHVETFSVIAGRAITERMGEI